MSPAFVVLEEVIKALKKNGTKQLKAFSTDTPDREIKDWLVNGNYVFFDYAFHIKGYHRVQVKEDIFKNLITQQLQELDLSQTRSPWTYEISAAAEIYNLLDVAAFKCPTVNIASLFEKF